MKIVLGGRFECAVLGRFANDGVALPKSAPGHSYYDALYRKLDPAFFSRSATLLTIAEETRLPMVDWVIQDQTRWATIQQSRDFSESDDDLRAFAALLLANGALSRPSLRSLMSGTNATGGPRIKVAEFGFTNIDSIAHHLLCRLLSQVRLASESNLTLILGYAEQRILAEIEKFVIHGHLPTPLALPSMASIDTLDGDSFLGGLVNFDPYDAYSLLAVREDRLVQKYAAQIREHLSRPFTSDSERTLLTAMKEAYEATERKREQLRAFEVEAKLLKPVTYIPGIDVILKIYGDGRDMFKKWLARDAENKSWHLISARMATVNVEEYLRRKHNLLGR